MKIAALLAWYDEPIPMLTRCIRSLAGVADVLIAFDGRWSLFPGESETSSKMQYVAVMAAAEDADLLLVTASRGWETQVEKRAALFAAARDVSADWALIMDADNYVERADAAALRAELERTERDVLMAAVNGRSHDRKRPYGGAVRRLYRVLPGLTVARAHNGYVTGDGRWLLGDHAYVELEPAETLPADVLTIGHDDTLRDIDRNAARTTYRVARRQAREEVWA